MKKSFLLTSLLCVSTVLAGERALVDTTRSPHALMYMPDLADVKWNGGLLGERFEVARSTMVPHMWEILSDEKASHAWHNYLIAAGELEGKFARSALQ